MNDTDLIIDLILNKNINAFELCHQFKLSLQKIERELYRINFFIHKPHIFERKIKKIGFEIRNTKKQKEINKDLYYRDLKRPYKDKEKLLKAYIQVKKIIIELPLLIKIFKKKNYSNYKISKICCINHAIINEIEDKKSPFLFSHSEKMILELHKKYNGKK